MKKAIAWLLVVAMTAAISIGATLAYLTDTDEDVNVMTVGQVKIDQLEYERVDVETNGDDAKVQEFRDNKPLYPAVTMDGWDTTDGVVDWEQIGKDGYTSGIWNPEKINNEVDKMVFVENEGDYDAYVRTVFAFEAGNYSTLDAFNAKVHLNLNTTDWDWEWTPAPVKIGEGTYFVATATYNKVLAPGMLTEISLSQIALDSSATNDDVAGLGDTYQVLVQSQAVQVDGFQNDMDELVNAKTALNEAFGTIPTADNKFPFDGDSATKGIDLKTALHYLDGNDISKKITSVTIGLNSKYADTVAGLEGTLVDVEQDIPAYAFYVPNGDNYDVYVLSDYTIYAPEDSSMLFKNLEIMTKLDTSNLNFGRAKLMNSLFSNCFALTEVDVTGWDVSNNTTFDRLFYTCKNLKIVKGLGTWNTGNVTTTFGAFYECQKLIDIDGVGDWDTSKVTTMAHMFRNCKSLPVLDIGDWDVGNVTEFNSMFNYLNTVTELDLTGWDMHSAQKLNHMFYGCVGLTEMNMANWDVTNVTTTSHMFCDCNYLESVDITGWNTVSLTSMDAMFNDCWRLKSVDMSSFVTDKCVEFSQLFENCSSLVEVKGMGGWNTSKGKCFGQMFMNCSSIKEIDFSSFDTRNATTNYTMQNNSYSEAMQYILRNNTSLEKLSLGKNFVFDGDGNLPESYFVQIPTPSNVEGWDGNWYNAETGEAFAPSEIPDSTAATYVAVKP